jgi:hypothetical protein
MRGSAMCGPFGRPRCSSLRYLIVTEHWSKRPTLNQGQRPPANPKR